MTSKLLKTDYIIKIKGKSFFHRCCKRRMIKLSLIEKSLFKENGFEPRYTYWPENYYIFCDICGSCYHDEGGCWIANDMSNEDKIRKFMLEKG